MRNAGPGAHDEQKQRLRGAGLHADRAARGNRDHRDSGGPAPARVITREGQGPADSMHQQPAPDRLRLQALLG